METDVLVTERNDVLFVTLNRPDRRNALSDAVLDRLLDLTGTMRGDLRAVVIRGAGGIFCAGGDIKQFKAALQGAPAADIARYNRRYGTVLRNLDELPVPVIAAVEGAAIGGGMGLAAIADVTIAERQAKFSLTETTLGLPPAQICAFVVARIGAHQARRLMLTAARFGADEAARIGLVDEVTDDVDAAIDAVLDRVRRCGPAANAMTKRLVAAMAEHSLDAFLDHAADAFAKAMLAPEAREGVQAFLDNRKPVWAA